RDAQGEPGSARRPRLGGRFLREPGGRALKAMEWRRDGYLISDDPALLDLDAIWDFLRTSYWAAGVPRAAIERSIENSLPFGLYDPQGELAGFARAVT